MLVDNSGPSPTTKRTVEAFAGSYLPLPDNPGYGSAVNAGVKHLDATPDFVLVCNPDAVLEPDALQQLLEVAAEYADAASFGPCILESDGSVYPSARELPNITTGIGHALLGNLRPNNRWSQRYHNRTQTDEPRQAGWLSGACLLIRNSAFESVGGFDPSFFMYFEDVDLGYRFTQAGWVNLYVPSAVITHSGAHSTQAYKSSMEKAHHQSAAHFLDKRYPGIWRWPLRKMLRLGLRARYALRTQKTS